MFELTPEMAWVAARNLLVGGNFASLSLLSDPRPMVAYVSEALFLFKAMASKRELPQRNIYEVLPTIEVSSITLGA